MIVKAESNHLKDITAIENQSFDKPWSLQSFLSEFSNKASSNWVYIKNNRVIGYLFGWKIDYDYHINNIAVDLLERRKGIAEKMIDNIIFNLNIKNIFLEVSNLKLLLIALISIILGGIILYYSNTYIIFLYTRFLFLLAVIQVATVATNTESIQ